MQTHECVISHMQFNFQNTNNLFLEVHSKSIWLKSVDPRSEWHDTSVYVQQRVRT